MQLCSKPRGARGIEPETFRRRGQLLSCPVHGDHESALNKNSFATVPKLCKIRLGHTDLMLMFASAKVLPEKFFF